MFRSFDLIALLSFLEPHTEAFRTTRRLRHAASDADISTKFEKDASKPHVSFMSNRKFQPFNDTTFNDCHPQCHWNCGSDSCNQVCQPVCAPPQCETICGEAKGCAWTCDPPICAVVCPGQCAHGNCPKCKTVCGPPRCKPRCNPDCESRCADPQCSWKCTPDPGCMKPNCNLDCADPCQTDFKDPNKYPDSPLPPGVHVMSRSLGGLNMSAMMPGLAPGGLLPNAGPQAPPMPPCQNVTAGNNTPAGAATNGTAGGNTPPAGGATANTGLIQEC